ncbi:MAG: hypothetical protein HY332_25660, partial [Chloroflexi bacterium]|nr:hypothetical protein [Chloroflexota bacterium]
MARRPETTERLLLAGVGRVDVTPPVGLELFGYHRLVPMAGVRDPLSITALALFDSAAAPAHPVVLLAADHIGMGLRATR